MDETLEDVDLWCFGGSEKMGLNGGDKVFLL